MSNAISTEQPIGLVTIGRTTYTVHRLPVGPNASTAGVRNQFALTGPRGAQFMVIDHGPKYRLNTLAIGRRGPCAVAPRELRGAKRSDFATFGVET